MKTVRLGVALATLVLLGAAATAQQVAVPPTIPAAPPTTPGTVLRQGTSIPFRTQQALNSKTTKVGDRFHLAVASDVLVGNLIAVPAGSDAVGEVTSVVKKGSFGKSGKIDTRLLYVHLGDRNIPLSGTMHNAGSGGTGATVATAVAVGVFSAFVTGHSADLPVGSPMTGFIESDIPLVGQPAAPPAPLLVSTVAAPPAAASSTSAAPAVSPDVASKPPS